MAGWTRQTITYNQQYVERDILIQAHEYSCALACIGMVINRLTYSRPTEHAIMNSVTNQGRPIRPVGGYIPAVKDRIDPNDLLARPDWSHYYVGVQVQAIPEYLKAYGIKATLLGNLRGANSRKAQSYIWESGKKPVIALVRVKRRRGNHFVVFDGFPPNFVPTSMNTWHLVVCDPEKGLGNSAALHFQPVKLSFMPVK